MASQESMLSDFSSTLLNVKPDNKPSDRLIVDVSSSDFDAVDNRNLSDVLTQIQDNGPADADSIIRDHVHMKTPDTAYVKDVSSYDVTNNEDTDNNETKRQETVNNNAAIKKIDPHNFSPIVQIVKRYLFDTRSQLVIIVSLSIVATIVMYKLDLRTRSIEQNVNAYNIEATKLSSFQDKNLLTEVTQLNTTLSTLQNKVKVFEKNLLSDSKKHEKTIESLIANKDSDKKLLSKKISVLEKEILVLKEELKNVNVKNVALTKDKAVTPSLVKHPSVKHTVNTKGLVVNLASLTNEDKARQILNKLSSSGLSPAMENVMIKGKQIYRISVSGFSDEKEAKQFIRKAGEQYGLSNGWIRKS